MITDPRYHPRVIQVVPARDFEILVYLDDGSITARPPQSPIKADR